MGLTNIPHTMTSEFAHKSVHYRLLLWIASVEYVYTAHHTVILVGRRAPDLARYSRIKCVKYSKMILCAYRYESFSPERQGLYRALASRGRYQFSSEEARKALGVSEAAAKLALNRLARRGLIASPARGFYVIVLPEYHRLGCLPAKQFIPSLMQRQGLDYYAGLLSAAQFHGAAHQRPQEFQVMLARARGPIFTAGRYASFSMYANASRTCRCRRSTRRAARSSSLRPKRRHRHQVTDALHLRLAALHGLQTAHTEHPVQ